MYCNWLYSPDCTSIWYDRHPIHVYHDRYPIVYMIWFGHLTLVLTALIIVHLYLACYYSLISVHIFIVLLMILIISSFIHNLLLCTHYLYARAPSFFLAHSLGRFLTTLNLHVQILDVLCYWSGVRWDWICCEKLEFLFTYSDIIVFLFIPIVSVVFLILYALLSVIIPFLYSYDIMCVRYLYFILRWYWFIMVII